MNDIIKQNSTKQGFFIKTLSNPKVIFALFVLLAIFFRFWHLNQSPGWFPDEGVDLSIAWNLLHGKMQLFAISYPFVPHPPLYFLVSFVPLAIFGKSIFALRFTSAIFALVNVYLIYLIAREITSSKLVARLAALIFIVFPIAIINGRYGLTYEFFLTLSYLAFYFSLKFMEEGRSKQLMWAAAMAGLAAITSYLGAIVILLVLVLTLIKSKRDFIKTLLLATGPFVIYIAVMYLIFRENFIGDIVYTFSRPEVIGGDVQTNSILARFGTMIGSSPFYFFAIPGLFLLKNRFRYIVPATACVLTLFELRFKNTAFFFTLFVSLGLALLFVNLYQFLRDKTQPWQPQRKFLKPTILILAMTLITLPLSLPAGAAAISIARGKWFGISSEKWYAPDNMADAQKAAEFVNSNTTSNDVVSASAHFSSLLNSSVCDPILMTVYEGYATTNFPKYFSPNRFMYNCSFRNVKFFVSDKFTENWYAFQPNIRQSVLDRIWTGWPVAFEAGEYKVFRNPSPIVVGNVTNPINQPFFRYDAVNALSNIRFSLGLQRVVAYKDKLKDYEISQIRQLFKIEEDRGDRMVINTGNDIRKAYISQKPVVLHSSNDRLFYKDSKKASFDASKNLVIDLSTPSANNNISLNELMALPNWLLLGSDQNNLINALALEKSDKTIAKIEANGGWLYTSECTQSYSDACVMAQNGEKLYVSLEAPKQDDYLVFARVYDSTVGQGKLSVSLDGKKLSDDITGRNQEGFFFKQIFDGQLTAGKHSLVFSNDGSGRSIIDTIYLVKKDSLTAQKDKISREIAIAEGNQKIKTRFSDLDLNQDDINYTYSEKNLDHISIKYTSGKPVVVAVPRAYSPNYKATDQDGKTYAPIVVNDQYLGFIVPKTGQVNLDIIYMVNKTK